MNNRFFHYYVFGKTSRIKTSQITQDLIFCSGLAGAGGVDELPEVEGCFLAFAFIHGCSNIPSNESLLNGSCCKSWKKLINLVNI